MMISEAIRSFIIPQAPPPLGLLEFRRPHFHVVAGFLNQRPAGVDEDLQFRQGRLVAGQAEVPGEGGQEGGTDHGFYSLTRGTSANPSTSPRSRRCRLPMRMASSFTRVSGIMSSFPRVERLPWDPTRDP